MKRVFFTLIVLILTNTSYSKNLNSYDDLDLTTKPKKVLSKSKTKAMWNIC